MSQYFTLAVQSFHMALKSPPLETNTVGQFLPGMKAIKLYTFLTGIEHLFLFLFLLRCGLE